MGGSFHLCRSTPSLAQYPICFGLGIQDGPELFQRLIFGIQIRVGLVGRSPLTIQARLFTDRCGDLSLQPGFFPGSSPLGNKDVDPE